MGSEMCIRDRRGARVGVPLGDAHAALHRVTLVDEEARTVADLVGCLLYTSDAADERSSVDLGGRRIIKKKISTSEAGDRVL